MTSSPTDLLERVRGRLAERYTDATVKALVPLEGGHSGLTYRADLAGGVSDWAVVKMAPEGRPATGRHDVLRQARLLDRLSSRGFPVPAVLLTDDVEPNWFMMSWVPGEAVEPVLGEGHVRGSLAARRMQVAAGLLAQLHQLDVENLGLGLEEVMTPAAELVRWQRTMGRVDPALRPRAEDLAERLHRSVPEPISACVVHGDYRLGNLLFLDDRPQALIDWEIWAVADPRVDLAWFAVFTDSANFPGASVEVEGLPNARDLLALYEERLGYPVPEMPWFHALAHYKMAAVMGHNLKRHREGVHHDPYQERLPATIVALVDRALEQPIGT